MKAKLVKENDYHYYLSIDGKIIADINAHPLSSINVSKLSKQNCDEIFGMVDVEKLIKEADTSHLSNWTSDSHEIMFDEGFKMGFAKKAELNKDNVFTLEDMKLMFEFGYRKNNLIETTFESALNFIQSLQKPIEIEVEIEMDDIWDGIDSARILPKEETSIPMLDKDGCLILKRAK